MYRYRINYTKEGPARYISHLDLVRTMERSLRRCGLPVAFSGGFNPHPRFSFALPLPVGVAGLNEYMDLDLITEVDPAEVGRLLGGALPRGIEVRGVRQAPEDSRPLMAMVKRASYRVTGRLRESLSGADLSRMIKEFLDRESIIIERQGKKGTGPRPVDIRPGILRLSGDLREHGELVLEMELQAGSVGNVRPEEALRALVGLTGLPAPAYGFDICRTSLDGFNLTNLA